MNIGTTTAELKKLFESVPPTKEAEDTIDLPTVGGSVSLTNQASDPEKMAEAAEPLMFKAAGPGELAARKEPVSIETVKGYIGQVKKNRTCGVCQGKLGPGTPYLLVIAGGSHSGGTVCEQCVKTAAKIMGGQA